MKTLPTLKQLQYFQALVQQKSFSEAAKQCYVTQSTLSAGIANLEDILGQPVVDRTHRKVVLTAYGETLIPQIEKILEQSESLLIEANAFNTPLYGSLKLGIIPTIAPYLLPKVLPTLQKNYPDLDLEIHEDLSDRLLSKLDEGIVEIILLAYPYSTKHLENIVIYEENFFLAAPKNMPIDQSVVDVDDLKDMNLLLLEDGHCLREHALEACHISSRKNKKTFSTTSLATLIQMVRHGFGVTLLPEMVAKWSPLDRDIQILPLSGTDYKRGIGLAWRKNHIRNNEFKLFAGEIKNIIQ